MSSSQIRKRSYATACPRTSVRIPQVRPPYDRAVRQSRSKTCQAKEHGSGGDKKKQQSQNRPPAQGKALAHRRDFTAEAARSYASI